MSDPFSLPTGRSVGDLVSHIFEMPRWHKTFLTLAVVLFGAGATGQVGSYFGSTPQRTLAPNHPSGSTEVQVAPDTTTQTPSETPVQWLSPHATRIGLSFVAALIIGWMARAFVKMVMLVATAFVGILLALSYFRIINIDFSQAQEQYSSTVGWAIGQAGHLASNLIHRLPSATTGGFGFFMGFRRR